MTNRSTAVVAQRHEPHDSLEDFPTPPWATRALMEYVLMPEFGSLKNYTVWEPCANRGFMVRPLREYFGRVIASDIHDYGLGYELQDFLLPNRIEQDEEFDFIITNPPYRLAEKFIHKAYSIARVGCFFILRLQFIEGRGRYYNLFSEKPPTIVAPFSGRVGMFKGRYVPDDDRPTAYCWFGWIKGQEPRPMQWIKPCKGLLLKKSDELII